jgi:hypothetical protein
LFIPPDLNAAFNCLLLTMVASSRDNNDTLQRRMTTKFEDPQEAAKLQRQTTSHAYTIGAAGEHVMELEWEEWDGSGSFTDHCLAGSFAGVAEHTVRFTCYYLCLVCIVLLMVVILLLLTLYANYTITNSATLSSRYNQNTNAGLLCRLSGKLGEKQYSSSISSSSTKWHVEYHEAIDDDHAGKRTCGQNGFHRCIGIRWFWALMARRSDHDGGMHSGSCAVLF